jgi:hypothetical protein
MCAVVLQISPDITLRSYKYRQCTDYWADAILGDLIVHHQRYQPSDSNKCQIYFMTLL